MPPALTREFSNNSADESAAQIFGGLTSMPESRRLLNRQYLAIWARSRRAAARCVLAVDITVSRVRKAGEPAIYQFIASGNDRRDNQTLRSLGTHGSVNSTWPPNKCCGHPVLSSPFNAFNGAFAVKGTRFCESCKQCPVFERIDVQNAQHFGAVENNHGDVDPTALINHLF